MTIERDMLTTEEFYFVRDLGYEAARDAYLKGAPCEDRDRFRDLVHPDAFSEAMEEYEDVAAAELSGVVDEGIASYLANVEEGVEG